MFFRHVRRALTHCAPVLLLLPALSAYAADDFAVSSAQIQALGVQLQRLDRPGQSEGLSYPAKVVLPPGQESIVSAPLAGVVDQLLVTEHQAVSKGQPLFRLVSPELGELQLKLMEAVSRSRLSQKTLARERQLFGEGIIPERRVQEAEAAAAQDLARMRQSEAALRLAGVDAATVGRMAGGGATQEGLLLRARSSGIVYGIDARPGQRVQDAHALARIADTGKLWLDIEIPVDMRTRIDVKGGAITVVGRDVAAVSAGAGVVASGNQTLTLRANVTRGAQHLRPGEFVQARVPFTADADGWSVPLQSVVRQGEKAYVFVRTPAGFRATPVAVLDGAGRSVRVKGSLRAGEEIATASVIALKAAWLGKGGSN